MRVTDGAKIFIKNDALDKYLFVLRDNIDTIPEPNTWSLIGGGLEDNETPLEAVNREISEEINIHIYDVHPFHKMAKTHTVQGKQHPITGYYFIGKTDESDIEKIQIKEGQKASFFTLDEILSVKNISPTIRKLINLYPSLFS